MKERTDWMVYIKLTLGLAMPNALVFIYFALDFTTSKAIIIALCFEAGGVLIGSLLMNYLHDGNCFKRIKQYNGY